MLLLVTAILFFIFSLVGVYAKSKKTSFIIIFLLFIPIFSSSTFALLLSRWTLKSNFSVWLSNKHSFHSFFIAVKNNYSAHVLSIRPLKSNRFFLEGFMEIVRKILLNAVY